MPKISLKYLDSLITDVEHLSKKLKILIVLITYAIMFFILLLYRYANQDRDLYYLTFNNTANIINIIHFSIIYTLLILCFFKMDRITEDDATKIFFFSSFNILLLPVSQMMPNFYKNAFSILIFFALIVFCVYIVFIIFSKSKRKFTKSLPASIIITIFVFLIVSIYILTYLPDNYKIQNSGSTYSAAVIFGAAVWQKNKPSPVLRERILKALNLYRSGRINYFVVTGGNARGEISEAEAAKLFLLEKGVEESKIVVENNTSSTSEQVKFIRDSLYIKRNDTMIILVSDNFHLRRITEMCKFNGIEPTGVASDSPLLEDNIIFYVFRESVGLILFWYFGL